MKTEARHIDIPTSDGTCDCYFTVPRASSSTTLSSFPAVLICMDAFGPRPQLYAMADQLAQEGFCVLIPNLFYRMKRAPFVTGPFPIKKEDMPEVRSQYMPLMQKFSPQDTLKDAPAFFNFLEQQLEVKKGPIGLTGYCMGGGVALRLAAAFPEKIGAVASFHGGQLVTDEPDSPHLLLPKIQASVYVAHADHDSSMTDEQIQLFQKALSKTKIPIVAEKYVGASHGFTMKDLPPYNDAAAKKHWQKLTSLFKENL